MRITFITASLIVVYGIVSCQQGNNRLTIAGAEAGTSTSEILPETPAAANIIYQSSDGGNTWQDVSAGLPPEFDPVRTIVLNGELILSSFTKGVYSSNTGLAKPNWQSKTLFNETVDNIFALKDGPVIRDNNNNYFRETIKGCIWNSVFRSLKTKMVYCMLESDNAILAGIDGGIIRSDDGGQSWAEIYRDRFVLQILESGGNLIAVNPEGLMLSTDGGKRWEKALPGNHEIMKAGRFGNGLFAIANLATKPNQRLSQLYTSSDDGKTWQAVEKSVLPFAFVSDYKQLGNQIICSHRGGISISFDQGKSWQLVHKLEGESSRADLIEAEGILYALLNVGC